MDLKLIEITNLLKTILWQYEDSKNIKALTSFNNDFFYEINNKYQIDFYNDIFNLKTATDYGLSIWSRILNIPISINKPINIDEVFGFGEDFEGFDNGSFGRFQSVDENVSTEVARVILLLRWFKMTRRPTIPAINEALEIAFGKGACYVTDTFDMDYAVFIFENNPNYKLLEILNNREILPVPAGVGSRWISLDIEPYFGFGEFYENFDNGGFML